MNVDTHVINRVNELKHAYMEERLHELIKKVGYFEVYQLCLQKGRFLEWLEIYYDPEGDEILEIYYHYVGGEENISGRIRKTTMEFRVLEQIVKKILRGRSKWVIKKR